MNTVRVRLTSQQCEAIARWLDLSGEETAPAADEFKKMARRTVRGAADRSIGREVAEYVVNRLTPWTGLKAGMLAALAKMFPQSDALAAYTGVREINTALHRQRGRPKKRGSDLASAAKRVYPLGDDGGRQRLKQREFLRRLHFEQAQVRGETILKAISKFSE